MSVHVSESECLDPFLSQDAAVARQHALLRCDHRAAVVTSGRGADTPLQVASYMPVGRGRAGGEGAREG